MKQLLLAIALLLSQITAIVTAYGQNGQSVNIKTPATISFGGKFNSSTVAGGSATAWTQTDRAWSIFPTYSKRDTVNNTGADTLYFKLATEVNSVYTWVNVTSISGTNTSCTAKFQVSGDTGSGTDWLTVQTFTVSASGNPYSVLVNSGVNWPYTNGRWIFTGVGTHSSSWYGGVMVR